MRNFPMRTFTVLLINLNYVRYRSPTLIKENLFRELSFRIRNSYPVGLGN